ncbi:MAG: bacterial Ig-like domain-containing protein [Treponema sp.]|nr:bacterial Ig-like domain-containing protein [Treponema sp.]
MKKFKKVLALLACSVLLGGGLLSCSSDGDDGSDENGLPPVDTASPSATLTYVADDFAVEAEGYTVNAEVTVTLKNETFKSAIEADKDIKSLVTLSPTDVVTVASVKTVEAVAAGATEAKLKVVAVVNKAGSVEVTFAGGALASSADLKATTKITTTIKGASAPTVLSGWWSLDAYVDEFNIPSATAEVSTETVLAPVTILPPVKWRADGTKDLGDGVARLGYIQLSAPDAGTEGKKKGLKFTVPAAATKITAYGKNNSKLTLLKEGESTGTLKEVAAGDYVPFEWEIANTEDTTYVIYNPDASTINLKAINVYVAGVALESISIASYPVQDEYAVGEEFNKTGLVVKAKYTDGQSKVVTPTLSGFDSATAGEKTITVSYTEGEVTKTAEFKVTVKEKAIASIAIKTEPTKKEYVTGDKIDLTGLVITVTYDNESTANVTYSSANASDFTTDFDSSAAAESKEVTVTYKEKTAKFSVKIAEATLFAKFDAKELYVNADGTVATADVNVTASKKSNDGTWELVIASGKKAQVKAGEFATYDYNAETNAGHKWTNRLSFNKQAEGNVALKLKVGVAKQVILRVDGGSVKDLPAASGESNFTFKGAGDAIVWKPAVSLVTTYVTVTGDDEGFVTITSSDTTVGANIYGITVVAEAVDTSTVELPTKLTTDAVYNKPAISGNAAEYTQGDTITATATVADPTKSTSTVVYANGTLGAKTEGTEAVDLTKIVWTAKGSAEDAQAITIGNGANLSFDTTQAAADTYTVTAAYTIGEGEAAVSYTSDPVTAQIKAAGATYFDVKFYDGETELTDLKASVASGDKVTKPADPTKGGFTFAGWYADSALTTAFSFDTVITAATTLYAKWEKSAADFTVANGVLTLNAASYDYYLSMDNLSSSEGDNAWSAVSVTDKTANKAGKTYFTETITCLNMSAPGRYITLKVNNVAAIDVHVFDSNGGRDYTVKVGDAAAVTYQSVKNTEGNIIETGTSGEVTVVIAGVSQSVYPVGVILYKDVPQKN